MFLKKILLLTIISSTLFASKERDVQGALDVIKYLFETKYAPLHFKEQTLGWNLQRSIKKLRGEIALTKNPRWLLKKFFLEPCDYHTCALFHSTASASLPFKVKKIDSSLFVSWVGSSCDDLQVGDEILSWDGLDSIEVFEEFKKFDVIDTIEMPSTDSLVEHYFTLRPGEYGFLVPNGVVHLTVLDHETLQIKEVELAWKVELEHFPFKGFIPGGKGAFQLENHEEPHPLLQKRAKFMAFSHGKTGDDRPSYELGSKRGFLPHLGPIVQSFKKGPFFYYIYKTPAGNKVAYLRLSSFDFERAELVTLKKAINYFEKQSDAMVLDVTHNPGGQVLNLFAILSYFLNAPTKNYQQNEILTSEEMDLAVSLKVNIEELLEDEEALLKFMKTQSQYNPSLTLAKQFLDYANFLLQSWENGERLTPLYPILGIDEIHPDPSCRYSKPLMVLTDPLSLSCGDFLPGILQETGRARLFGQRTGGAGGTVTLPVEFPNPLGIKLIMLTTSIVYKHDGDWIENKGIAPDIEYTLTKEDLQWDYGGYVDRLNEEMDSYIEEMGSLY